MMLKTRIKKRTKGIINSIIHRIRTIIGLNKAEAKLHDTRQILFWIDEKLRILELKVKKMEGYEKN